MEKKKPKKPIPHDACAICKAALNGNRHAWCGDWYCNDCWKVLFGSMEKKK